jgi:hypothetical protein
VALVELHDEGFRAWRAHERGRDEQAWARVEEIARQMGDDLKLFVAYAWADGRTGSKDGRSLPWLVERLREAGFDVTMPRPVGEETG